MNCPVCNLWISQETVYRHLIFHHQMGIEEMIIILFLGIDKLNERINNLCELLEVREK